LHYRSKGLNQSPIYLQPQNPQDVKRNNNGISHNPDYQPDVSLRVNLKIA
jgi:hypothetical protein